MNLIDSNPHCPYHFRGVHPNKLVLPKWDTHQSNKRWRCESSVVLVHYIVRDNLHSQVVASWTVFRTVPPSIHPSTVQVSCYRCNTNQLPEENGKLAYRDNCDEIHHRKCDKTRMSLYIEMILLEYVHGYNTVCIYNIYSCIYFKL